MKATYENFAADFKRYSFTSEQQITYQMLFAQQEVLNRLSKEVVDTTDVDRERYKDPKYFAALMVDALNGLQLKIDTTIKQMQQDGESRNN
jgi:hypothetical protein